MTNSVIAFGETFKWRGWVSAAVLLPIVAGAAFSAPWAAEGTWIDVSADCVAWLLLACGLFLRLWATLYIGGRKSKSLVVAGPYAMCRHPLYLGSLLIAMALATFMLSMSILAAVVLLALVYALILVPSEERYVGALLGNAYDAYAATTPRFLPRWPFTIGAGIIEVKTRPFLRECTRAFGLIALGAGVDLLACCRSQGWWPTPFGLP